MPTAKLSHAQQAGLANGPTVYMSIRMKLACLIVTKSYTTSPGTCGVAILQQSGYGFTLDGDFFRGRL